jgi:hypothetical protein
MESLQLAHVAIEIGILLAVIRATFIVAKLEFRVELMWDEFSKRLKMLEENGKES